MIDVTQILSFYEQGRLKAESVVANLFILQNGTLSDNELAAKMHRHPRTIKRYRAEMAKLPPVSEFVFINKLTNQQEQDHDPISEVLSKYGKLPLLSQVHGAFVRNGIEPNAMALEYLIKYTLKGVKQNRVHSFTQYLLWCIANLWGMALVETADQKTETLEDTSTTVEAVIAASEDQVADIKVVSPDPVASAIWDQVYVELSKIIPRVSQELLIKQIVPTSVENNCVHLLVNSTFARDYIQSRLFIQLDEQFSKIGYHYCLTEKIILAG